MLIFSTRILSAPLSEQRKYDSNVLAAKKSQLKKKIKKPALKEIDPPRPEI